MNIIILGAGQVGSTLAESLEHEKNDITVIDTDAEKLRYLQERIDIRTIEGNGALPNVLLQADAKDTEMLIAVTDNDETNIVACQVAYTLFKIPTKVARIRATQYLAHQELFCNEAIPIDYRISPESLVTNSIQRLIEHPGALQVLDFADGQVQLIAIKSYYGGEQVGHTLKDFYQSLPDIALRIVAIYRSNRSISFCENTTIEIGDEIFLIAAKQNIKKIMGALRKIDSDYKRVMIAGGGNIGSRLAKALEQDYQVKVIEHNQTKAEKLAEELTKGAVLYGDVSDRDLLISENIEYVDVFCSLTNDDEANIMSGLLAKKLGVRQAMALITRKAYIDLIEGGKIDIAISPQQATIGSILTRLRKGDVVNVYSLRRGAAEAIEIIVHGDKKTSKVVGRKVEEIKLPPNTQIGAVVRGKHIMITCDQVVIEPEDHVVVVVIDKNRIPEVEKLFQVSVRHF